MKIFFTPSVNHLKQYIPGEHGQYKLRKFNDGELFFKLEENVEKQPVTVITATYPPTKHFSEIFFLLDTLKQQNAVVHAIFTYFGYERQDHPKPNVARAARIIANCFKQFELNRITIIHPHSQLLQKEIPYASFFPFQLYTPLIKQLEIDTIVSPDNGGIFACQELATETNCLVGSIEKERISNNQIIPGTINLPSGIKRALIFDDIISTGSTIIQAAIILQEHGATDIYAIATHSFINELALQKIVESPVKHLWVSNSVPVYFSSPQLTVINIAPVLKQLIAHDMLNT